MSKCGEIRDFCGDYAFKVEYSEDNEFTMFFNSRRNAETVKRCIEVDDSVPNVATAVDFVEVVRCKDCKYFKCEEHGPMRWCDHPSNIIVTEARAKRLHVLSVSDDHYCAYGERKNENEG